MSTDTQVSPHETSLKNITDFLAELEVVHQDFAQQLSARESPQQLTELIARMTGSGLPSKFFSIPTLEPGPKDSYDNAAQSQPDFSHVLNNIMDSSYDDQNRSQLDIKALRSLANLCGGVSSPEYVTACAQLHFFYNHFSRPAMILELEQEDVSILSPKSTLLTIGRSPAINFNWEPDFSSCEPGTGLHQPKDPLQPLVLNGTPLESFAASVWSLSQFRTGHGLVKMCHKYDFLPQVVHSLMSGRPTIIYGPVRCKRRIRQLVRACSIFVPGVANSGRRIEEWRTSPIRLPELATLKLVGLSKQPKGLPEAVRRHSTIFDVENEWVWCPPYAGDFLTSLLSPQVHISWPSEEVFLSFVQEQLHHLALRAALYYHLCCVGIAEVHPYSLALIGIGTPSSEHRINQNQALPSVSGSPSYEALMSQKDKGKRKQRPNSLSLLPVGSIDRKVRSSRSGGEMQTADLPFVTREATSDTYIHTNPEQIGSESLLSARFHSTETSDVRVRDAFFNRFGVKEHDQQIIEYLVRLIKTEQTLEMEKMNHSAHFPRSVAPTIRLAPIPCQLFKNKPRQDNSATRPPTPVMPRVRERRTEHMERKIL
ncbi:MAG: hypothetical protein Q8P67_06225 [archaeon]|nr:hypothetical protein [archaeon]